MDDIEVMGSGDEPSYSFQPPPSEEGGGPQIIYPDTLPGCTDSMTWEPSIDRQGMDYWNGGVGEASTPLEDRPYICRDLCLEDSYCDAFTYVYNPGVCWLKHGQPDQTRGAGMVSGIKECK